MSFADPEAHSPITRSAFPLTFPPTMSPTATDTAPALQELAALTRELIERNRTLVAECDSLYEHIEAITQRLSAREADILSLKQNHAAPDVLLREEAERDQRRLARLRVELDAYLSEIDARALSRDAQQASPQVGSQQTAAASREAQSADANV